MITSDKHARMTMSWRIGMPPAAAPSTAVEACTSPDPKITNMTTSGLGNRSGTGRLWKVGFLRLFGEKKRYDRRKDERDDRNLVEVLFDEVDDTDRSERDPGSSFH